MANYKIIQDIEAEDKLIGSLTLRQFIYAGVTALCLYLAYVCIIKHLDVFFVVLIPVGLFSGFFAFPWKLNQPTEVWALARIRFFLKPRQRKWDQNNLKEMVIITAPKEIVTDYTKGLSANEISSRLKTLANTLDSRGWAIKNASNSAVIQPSQIVPGNPDRLIDLQNFTSQAPPADVAAADEAIDNQNHSIAERFDQMITSSSNDLRKNIVNQLQNSQAVPGSVIKDKQNPAVTGHSNSSVARNWFAGPSRDDPLPNIITSTGEVLNKPKPKPSVQRITPIAPVTETPYADILKLANNNDLNVATIARQLGPKEVVINLH